MVSSMSYVHICRKWVNHIIVSHNKIGCKINNVCQIRATGLVLPMLHTTVFSKLCNLITDRIRSVGGGKVLFSQSCVIHSVYTGGVGFMFGLRGVGVWSEAEGDLVRGVLSTGAVAKLGGGNQVPATIGMHTTGMHSSLSNS